MQSMNERQAEEYRLIVKSPARAMWRVTLGLPDMMYDNSESMIAAFKIIGHGIGFVFKGLWLALLGLSLFGRCLLSALMHIIILAFSPAIKLYCVLGARREIMRRHPEYTSPRRVKP